MKLKNHIPNLVTLGNLFCGLAALVVLLRGGDLPDRHWIAAGLVGAGLVFDFMDGLVARALKATSEIGGQLDSLADLVTFGAVPGMMVFELLGLPNASDPLVAVLDRPEALVAALIPLASAYRLAKFNVDDRPRDKFYGLPSPANALFFVSLYLIAHTQPQPDGFPFFSLLVQPEVLIALTLLGSFLLLSNLPLLSFKFTTLAFRPNFTRFLLLALSIVFLAIWTYKAGPLILFSYLLLSLLDTFLAPKQ